MMKKRGHLSFKKLHFFSFCHLTKGHFESTGTLGAERVTGCDPRTSNGAAYGASRRIL
jgi:hypothetical protein